MAASDFSCNFFRILTSGLEQCEWLCALPVCNEEYSFSILLQPLEHLSEIFIWWVVKQFWRVCGCGAVKERVSSRDGQLEHKSNCQFHLFRFEFQSDRGFDSLWLRNWQIIIVRPIYYAYPKIFQNLGFNGWTWNWHTTPLVQLEMCPKIYPWPLRVSGVQF